MRSEQPSGGEWTTMKSPSQIGESVSEGGSEGGREGG